MFKIFLNSNSNKLLAPLRERSRSLRRSSTRLSA